MNRTGSLLLTLRVWRQAGPGERGRFETYQPSGLTPDMSFVEMLDVLNEQLAAEGIEPVCFESDCREGICGSCGFLIDGRPHGPVPGATVCQLHLRDLPPRATLQLEPFRAASLPVIRDLVVDRSALDRIVASGGYVSVAAGSAPEAHALPVSRDAAERAFEAATCIGCAACVAACPNASAMLFTAAKAVHLGSLPQGEIEHPERVRALVAAQDREAFGACSNAGACAASCPKRIGLEVIARFNGDVLRSRTRRP